MPTSIPKLLPNKRANYRASTAQLGLNTSIPESVRAMAEKAVDQSREVYERSKEALDASGSTDGMSETFEQLDELLVTGRLKGSGTAKIVFKGTLDGKQVSFTRSRTTPTSSPTTPTSVSGTPSSVRKERAQWPTSWVRRWRCMIRIRRRASRVGPGCV